MSLSVIFNPGDSQSVEEEVLDDEDMDAEDSGSQKADEKLIAEGDGKKRFVGFGSAHCGTGQRKKKSTS